MSSSIDALRLRHAWGRKAWEVPQPFGPDGWSMQSQDSESSIIVSCAALDGVDWIHASIAHAAHLPSYPELVLLHRSVFNGWAYQVFAPDADHVNIHEYALHLWGRLDGAPILPNFGASGTI